MSLILPRRGLLIGLAAMIAAPAVVRASSLMPIRGEEPYVHVVLGYQFRDADGHVHMVAEDQMLKRSEFENAAPKRKDPGDYYWSNLMTGGPEGQLRAASGLLISTTPRLHTFSGGGGVPWISTPWKPSNRSVTNG